MHFGLQSKEGDLDELSKDLTHQKNLLEQRARQMGGDASGKGYARLTKEIADY